MELTLLRQVGTQISVVCDGQFSHTFDLRTIVPDDEKHLVNPPTDPVAYGTSLFRVLFPADTSARTALDGSPERILLVTTDNELDAVPWEYTYGPSGLEASEDFLVLDCHFVRGLPAHQRIAPPALKHGLHIIAIPSHPLSHTLDPLNIDGEWMRLKDSILALPYAVTLERTRPSTLERVRHLVANQHDRIVHFMGHGGQTKDGAVLCFEKDNGDLDQVTARDFMRRVRGTVFLVTLNACASATPGETHLSNLAAALVQQKTPYALGMRFSIPDEDALTFSRAFYGDLARGSSVEEALYQARLALSQKQHQWVIGVPVLYTALSAPAAGFASIEGTPVIKEYLPHSEISILPRAEGAFQGRIDALKQLGTWLTGDSRPSLVTIHGGGGMGKTALAREAVDRFAHTWPGGVWATSLENLPSRELFVNDLARFLNIDTQKTPDPGEVERLVKAQLAHQRTLIVLDNAETLIEAVHMNNQEAVLLAQFIREQLPRPPVSLLATSRSHLGWSNEVAIELEGLQPAEGVRLFEQHAPQKARERDRVQAWELSEHIEGHPLSLRLLASAFNASAISFSAFVEEYEAHLLQAEDIYKEGDHRHRTLYASIETSVRYLDADMRFLLSGLWVFHARFLPETAMAIFDPEAEGAEDSSSLLADRLRALWQRGLLSREIVTVRDGTRTFYHLLPTIRPYVEQYLEQAYARETLQARFGVVYSQLVRSLYLELDKSAVAVAIARQTREDLERGEISVAGLEKGYYLLYWAWIRHRLGNPQTALRTLEQALEIAQGQDQSLAFHAFNNMALIYDAMGKLREALNLYKQALLARQEVGDRAGEAAALNNMAMVYQNLGQPQQALALYEQALPITRALDNHEGEAATLSNMAMVLKATGQPQRALELYEQALSIQREIGNRVGEATTLNNMAMVYQALGQPQRALEIHEQALPIRREMGDQVGEAATLNNIAMVYHTAGKLQEALTYYEQALPIMREGSSRADEAKTVNNIALVYKTMGKLQEALTYYEQALSITREVGNKASEATTLSNMAVIYRLTRQYQEAFTLYEQALPIIREVGNRAGEVAALNGLAYLYRDMQRYPEALATFEQFITLAQQIALPAAEAAGLVDTALLLHQHLNRTADAITAMENAIALLTKAGLSQDAARRTIGDLQTRLRAMS